MVHINKGNGPKAGHGEYLACAKARVGKGCEYHSIPYLLLESALLQYCREIDLGALLEQDSRAEAIKQAQADLDTVAGALLAVKEKVEGIVATIPAVKNESMRAMLVEQLDKAGEEQDSLQRQRDRAASNLEALKRSGQTVANHVQIIRELDSKMKDVGEGERIAIRRSLKHAIARAVEKIVIYPEGLQRRIPSIESDGSIDLSEKNPDGWPEDMQSLFHGLVAMETGRENAAFLVKFRNGHHRLFKWNNAAKEFRQVIQTALVAGRAEVSPLDGVATTFDKDGNEILLCPDGINENESGQLGE